MAEIKIAGIMRAGMFSPNRIGSDAAIFNIVAEQLRKRGCEVRLYSEEQFIAEGVEERIVLNMCREKRSISLLQKIEDDGALVINSGYGIENCGRERLTRILLGSGIPFPDSIVVNSDEAVRDTFVKARFTRCWIKRADYQSLHKEDVSYVRQADEAQEVLQEYFLRGIKRAVINIHLEGDLVKFYGVQGTDYFFWFYPYDAGHSKYGLEAINGKSRGIKFDEAELRRICEEASEALDVKIYGGDCIIDPDGSIRIIDFNDWPSFAPCRQEAAPYIAKCILTTIKDHTSK